MSRVVVAPFCPVPSGVSRLDFHESDTLEIVLKYGLSSVTWQQATYWSSKTQANKAPTKMLQLRNAMSTTESKPFAR